MENETILHLLLMANAGDRLAYKELLEWLQKHCLTQVSSALRIYNDFPKELIKDISQEVLITFHQTHQSFDTKRPFLPWINTLIRYKSIDFLRKKDFRVQMSGVDLDLIAETWPGADEKDPVETEEFMILIEELPPKQSRILKLSKLEGLTNKEIAQELNMSESNVKVSIHRAISFLKKLVSGHTR